MSYRKQCLTAEKYGAHRKCESLHQTATRLKAQTWTSSDCAGIPMMPHSLIQVSFTSHISGVGIITKKTEKNRSNIHRSRI